MPEREEKDCRDCHCREHDVMTAVMDRLHTWKAAKSALAEVKFTGEDNELSPSDILVLANWMWTGDSILGD